MDGGWERGPYGGSGQDPWRMPGPDPMPGPGGLQGPAGPGGVPSWPLASIGRRFVGYVIDEVILLVIAGIAGAQYHIVTRTGGRETVSIPESFLFLVLGITAVYQVGLVALRGQTIGCVMMGIRIQDATTGATPKVRQAFLRWLVPNLPGVIPLVALSLLLRLVVYVPMFTDRLKRGLHDRAAHTLVVRVR